jgi:hypothetical protein
VVRPSAPGRPPCRRRCRTRSPFSGEPGRRNQRAPSRPPSEQRRSHQLKYESQIGRGNYLTESSGNYVTVDTHSQCRGRGFESHHLHQMGFTPLGGPRLRTIWPGVVVSVDLRIRSESGTRAHYGAGPGCRQVLDVVGHGDGQLQIGPPALTVQARYRRLGAPPRTSQFLLGP